MSWEREPLFTKARLYFKKAYQEDREDQFFGLLCSLGLELLARSAISHVSPTLLAEPDRDQNNLLHALSLGSAKHQKKSIATIQVLLLCKTLIQNFNEEQFKAASALISRRNEEVHTGTAAFHQYPTQQWIAGFYKCCKILCEFQEESLESLLEDDIHEEAVIIIQEIEEEVLSKTKSSIAAHRKVFENKSEERRKDLQKFAHDNSVRLSFRRHHKVVCPSCESTATVTGEPYGKDFIENKETEIIIRQSILPTKFNCISCELQLTGYSALIAAEVANHFTRKTVYTPEEYYDLINPNDEERIEEIYIENNPDIYEWSNE